MMTMLSMMTTMMMTMLSMMMTGKQAWLVTARCAGDCRATSLRLRLASGQVDQPDDDDDDDGDDDDDNDDDACQWRDRSTSSR